MAYGWATPPAWVRTSGMAEAWAIVLTLRGNAGPPTIVTDCLGVVNTAQAGALAAMSHKNTSARIWREIIELSAGNLIELRRRLTWMPSHEAIDGVQGMLKSDGKNVTIPEWRANQLADKLAKRGAGCSALRDAADGKIKLAGKALCFHAAQLGVVTRAANKHRIEYTDKNGKEAHRFIRDSSTIERQKKSGPVPHSSLGAAAAAVPPPAPSCSATAAGPSLQAVQPTPPPSRCSEKASRARAHAATRVAAALEATNAVAQAIAATTVPASGVSALDRLGAVRERVRARLASAPEHRLRSSTPSVLARPMCMRSECCGHMCVCPVPARLVVGETAFPSFFQLEPDPPGRGSELSRSP